MVSTLFLLSLLPAILAAPTAEIVKRAKPAYNPSGPKRGLPFNNPTTYIQHFNGGQVNWAYNWDSSTDSSFPYSYLEFVPMLWGISSDHTSVWAANAQAAINKGSNHLLSFNEPDGCTSGGSCIDYVTAAANYKTYMNPFYSQAYLGTPAIQGSPTGLVYLQNFMTQCKSIGCEIDFVVVHWYDSASNIAWLKSFLTQAKAIAGTYNLWITEFRAAGTEAEQEAFLKEALPYLDQTTWVSHYAWFWASPTADTGALVLSTGYPSALGNVYAYTAW